MASKMKLWRYSHRPPSREVRETCKWDKVGQIVHKLRFWPDLDRTNHQTNLIIGLLVIYAALNVPNNVQDALRGETGKWIACATLALYIFFPMLAPEDLDIPAAWALLVASTPKALAVEFRKTKAAMLINVAIAVYLFYQHVQNGGLRRCITDKPSIPVTIGIVLMFVAPLIEAFSDQTWPSAYVIKLY